MEGLFVQKLPRALCALVLMLGVLLSAGCGADTPAPTQAPTQATTEPAAVPETTQPTQTDPTEQQESADGEAAALLGSWERTYTEVEGYRQTAEAGACSLTVTQREDGALQITYTDREFPDNSYEDKALHIVPNQQGGYFTGSAWVAQVDHTGNFGMTYSLVLLEDGSLLLCNSWLMEGAPMVSYEWFGKVSG